MVDNTPVDIEIRKIDEHLMVHFKSKFAYNMVLKSSYLRKHLDQSTNTLKVEDKAGGRFLMWCAGFNFKIDTDVVLTLKFKK